MDLSFFLEVRYSKLQDYSQPTKLAEKISEEIRKYVLKTLGTSKDY
ncbi:hypothetical protein [Helicobacter bizzozeronii]|nr:hypothetical protein [Helicobacter bizzozeronii]